MQKRPASLTVFGILNIIFGILGVFGIISSYAMLNSDMMASNPAIKVMHEQPGYLTWIKISLPLGLAATVAAIISGIGLFKMQNWGRKLAIGYALFGIVSSIVSMFMTYRFVAVPMMEMAKRSQGPEAAGAIGGAIGGMVGSVFALVYPIILLVFMTRPSVIAACTGTPPPLPQA